MKNRWKKWPLHVVVCMMLCVVFICAGFDHAQSLSYTGYGANQIVSGSMHILDFGDYRCALDAGLFYGKDALMGKQITKEVVSDLDCLILSHIHLDHSGRILQMTKLGYDKPIYCSELTRELLPTMLQMVVEYGGGFGEEEMENSQSSLEKHLEAGKIPVLHSCIDCKYAKLISSENRRTLMIEREEINERKFRLCGICMNMEINQILKLVEPIKLGVETKLNNYLKFTFFPMPHLPGAVFTLIRDNRTEKLLFYTGDAGSGLSSFLGKQGEIQKADIIILEGTYGFGEKTELPSKIGFLEYLAACIDANKQIIIPAFVLDRSQQVIATVKQGVESGMLPDSTRVSLLSPSANEITEIYLDVFPKYRNVGLSDNYSQIADFRAYYDEIRNLDEWDGKSILVTSSGMANMAFSMEAVEKYVSNTDTVFIFVGYQDPETIGGELNDIYGSNEITVDGKNYPVQANIEKFDCFSGHASFSQMCELLDNIAGFSSIILVHHNDYDTEELTSAYKERYPGVQVIAPQSGDVVELY